MAIKFDICPRCEKVKNFVKPKDGESALFSSAGEMGFTNTLCDTCKAELIAEIGRAHV